MLTKFLLTISFLFFFQQISIACGCFPVCNGIEKPKKCAKKMLDFAEAGYYGKAVSIEQTDNNGGYKVKFEVQRAWKLIKTKEVFVLAYRDNGANCGIDFEIGKMYLIFANGNNEKLSANGCSVADEYLLTYLGKGHKLK